MTDDPAGGKFPGRGNNHRLNRPTGEPQPDPRLDGLGPNRAMVLAPGQHGPNAPQQPHPDETSQAELPDETPRAELPDDTPDPHFTPNSNSHPQTPVSQPGHVHVDGTPTHHVGQNLPDASQAMPGPAMTPVFFRRSVDGTPAHHAAQHDPYVGEEPYRSVPRPDDTPHRTPLDEGLTWVNEGGEEKLKWLGDPKDAPFLDNGPYEVHLNVSGELEQSYNPADRDDASHATYYEPSSADSRDLHIGGHPDESGFMAMPNGELRWVGPRDDVPLTPDGHVSLGDKGEVVVDPPPEVFRADYREREPFAGERSEFGDRSGHGDRLEPAGHHRQEPFTGERADFGDRSGGQGDALPSAEPAGYHKQEPFTGDERSGFGDRSGGQGDALPSAEPAGYREREPFVGDERSGFGDRSGGQGDSLPSAEPTTLVKPVHSVQPENGTSGSPEESGLAWVNGDGTWKLKWVGDPKDAPLLDNGPYEARIGKNGDVQTLYNGHDEGDPTKVFASGKPGSGNPDDGTAGLIVMPNGDLRWVGPRNKAPFLDDGKVVLGKDGKIEFGGPKCAPDGTTRTEGTQRPLAIQDPNSDGPPPGFHGLPTYGSLPGEGRQGVKPYSPREERTGDGGGSGGSSGGQGDGPLTRGVRAPMPIAKEADGKGGGGNSGGSAGGQGDGPLGRAVAVQAPMAKVGDGKGGGGGSGGSAGGQEAVPGKPVTSIKPVAKVEDGKGGGGGQEGNGKGGGGGSGGSAGGQGDGLLQPRTLYKPVAKESDGKGGSGGQEGNGGGSGGSAGGQGDGPLTRGVKVQAPMAKVGDGKGSGGGSGGSAGGQGAVPGEPVTSIKPVAKEGDGKGGDGKGGDGKGGDGKGGDGKEGDGKGGDGKGGDGKGGDGKEGDGKEGDGKGGDGKGGDGKGGDGKEGDGKGGDGKGGDGKGGDGKGGDGKGGDGKGGDGKGGDGKDGKPKPLPAVKSADGKGNLRFNKDDWLKLLGALHDVENGLIDYAAISKYGELNGTFRAQPRDTQWEPAKDLNARASKFGGSVETVNEALRQRLSTVVNAMRWAIEVFENTDDLANYSLNDFVTEFPDLNSGGGKMSGGQGSGGN
ncbi:hypothetical protein [Saccharopolyspora shandongensis]|uniref:hypothetical protein n=1 Tax=Saccharopolyspora shandongensis TaxID=418495 RepID=UPI0033C84243